ncbi:MAG TPA: chemotaxis protein CheC [Thermodesulfobacteriota bacterium]|nr:chemotaxis protein CheC [Thermodesulfobacteriota bacterium]
MPIGQLTPQHLDVLKELSNIGVGHAATALSQMLGRRVGIRVPCVTVAPFDRVADRLGGPEAIVVAVALRMAGDATGQILLVLPRRAAEELAGALTAAPDRTADLAQTLARSALQEAGNVLAGAYLNALGRLTGLVLLPSVPCLTCDMAGAVVDEALVEQSEGGELALLMETAFDVEGASVSGQFLLLPHPASLARILGAVGVRL